MEFTLSQVKPSELHTCTHTTNKRDARSLVMEWKNKHHSSYYLAGFFSSVHKLCLHCGAKTLGVCYTCKHTHILKADSKIRLKHVMKEKNGICVAVSQLFDVFFSFFPSFFLLIIPNPQTSPDAHCSTHLTNLASIHPSIHPSI